MISAQELRANTWPSRLTFLTTLEPQLWQAQQEGKTSLKSDLKLDAEACKILIALGYSLFHNTDHTSTIYWD